MKKRLFYLCVVMLLLFLLPYSSVYADNCGSLSDCFQGNLQPALWLLLGLLIVLLVVFFWPVIVEFTAGVLFRGILTNAARIASSRIITPLVRAALTARLRAATAGAITGLRNHGLEQILSRDRTGVATRAVADAVKNFVEKIPQAGDKIQYVGKDAVVVLNKAGEVITAWAKNSGAWRWFN